MFLSLYMSVLYGLLYMFFIAYPIVYEEGKGYSHSITGLMFIPVAVGVLLSAACAPFVNNHYMQLVTKHNGKPPAEARLWLMMLSCWFIPIGLFIFAWTSYPSLSWAGPALGGLPVGFGFIFLYNSANNYIVDPTRTKRHPLSRRKLASAAFGVALPSSSPLKCITDWAINGLALSSLSLPSPAAPFRTSSTTMVRGFASEASLRTLGTRRFRKRVRSRDLSIKSVEEFNRKLVHRLRNLHFYSEHC